MSVLQIPPHLKIAESVTEEEYMSAIRQRKIVVLSLIAAGILVTSPLVITYGIYIGIPTSVMLLLFIERMLNRIFKNAHKVRTIRMVRYKELKIYKEQMKLLKEKAIPPSV